MLLHHGIGTPQNQLSSVDSVQKMNMLCAGMPVSSTHCQIGSIVAVGIVENGPGSVQWSVFYKILVAWGVTVPLAAAVAALLLAALRPVLA